MTQTIAGVEPLRASLAGVVFHRNANIEPALPA